MERTRRRAQRHVEQRHDGAAMHGAEAVPEMSFNRHGEPRRALAELFGEDLQVRDKRNFLLVFTRVLHAHRSAHMIVAPPSTAIAWPVMCRDASEASSTTRPFRSSSLPRRLFGVTSSTSLPSVSSVAFVIFEGKNPGQIAFTVMPCSPHSAASWRVRPTSPCLVAL